MSHLVDTAEMYLKAVYELEEEGIPPLRARLVERLEQSKPTVSETVARLERDGLMHVKNNRVVALTEEGKRQATRVMRKHRLAERLLLDVLGMPWPDVHEEACRWEHVMSDAVEERLETLLEHTDVDPYGNPIPGVEGVASSAVRERKTPSDPWEMTRTTSACVVSGDALLLVISTRVAPRAPASPSTASTMAGVRSKALARRTARGGMPLSACAHRSVPASTTTPPRR